MRFLNGFKKRSSRLPLKTRKFSNRESGLALVLVLSLIGVILSLLAEVLFESEVVSRASVGERDRVRAEMAATTGSQLALFFVTLEAKVKGLKANKSLPEGVRAGIDAMVKTFESQLGGKSLAQLLNDFPIGSQGFESIENFGELNLSKLADGKLIEALKAVPGYFVVHVSDESSKLNVNFLADRSLAKHMRNALIRVFSTTREKDFLESLGFSPERLASNLQDYIDADRNDSLQSSDEDTVYQQAKLLYTPKNGPLESVEELRRVPGFHIDEIYEIFSPYLTVWPLQADQRQLNINKAPNELVAALTTQPDNEVNDPLMDRFEDKQASGESFTAKDDRDFREFFKNGGSPDRDTDEILRWIAGFDSSVYKVTVRGVSNQVERTMELIAVYEEKSISASGANAEKPADDATTVDPNANLDENGNPKSSPNPADKSKANDPKNTQNANSDPKEGKIRVVYQRFK